MKVQPVRIRSVIALSIAIFAVVSLTACGSESSNSGVASETSDNSTGSTDSLGSRTSMIVANDNIYALNDFVTAGYKGVTQFDVETLPGAVDAWYGFFSQKDYEIRFYESHQSALELGVEPADIAIGKDPTGYSKRPPVRFDAYAVVGNVVMLCELEIESCEALIAELP